MTNDKIFHTLPFIMSSLLFMAFLRKLPTFEEKSGNFL